MSARSARKQPTRAVSPLAPDAASVALLGIRHTCIASQQWAVGARRSRRLLSLRDTARAMSQENVEIVKSIYGEWERGDFGSAEWAHPDIEYVITDGPTAGRWTGLAGLREGFHQFVDAWDELHVTATEYRELDDKRVLVFTRLSGRGKASGLDLEQMQAKGADVLHVRAGKVLKFVLYHDRERALADLGLSE